MIALYALFVLSVFFPLYTYVLYPVILRLLKGKQFKLGDDKPSVCVVIVGENEADKIKNVEQCKYSDLEIIAGNYNSETRKQIIVFTDTKTQLDLAAIQNIVKPFADDRVGCVVGQQTNPSGNNLFWKYESRVKQLESRIGCVSGATGSLFAVRKSDMPNVEEKVLNKPFYIATKIVENGKAVVYQEYAKAYESTTVGTNFRKHVEDATGYWQCFILFPKMLGSFVYVSHRVMKWFVWLNMVILLVSSGMLGAAGSMLMMVLFWLQVTGYAMIVLLGRRKIGGFIGKIIGIGYYFFMLNIAYFVGMFKVNS